MSLSQPGYAGDVTVVEAWEGLKADPKATLIDVRTQAEWTYVGVPSLTSIGKSPLLVEWHSFGAPPDPDAFTAAVIAELAGLGIDRDTPLYLICRSGQRSRSAAMALSAAGFEHCFNVASGFEGPLDPERHRGRRGGWKAEGLPWTQT